VIDSEVSAVEQADRLAIRELMIAHLRYGHP
jgi:hypothetical protein